MAFWFPLGFVALLFAWLAFSQRRGRRKLLARFRAEWGNPSERARNIPSISLYHRTLAVKDESPLDDRTGNDLDLDEVFAALDRTESAIGRQLLYHRLRTTPTLDNVAVFESLMTLVSEDSTQREQAQLSLARLREDSGDVWWLAQPGVLAKRREDVVFPLLAPVVPVALLLATVWPQGLGVAIVGIFVNLIVRYVMACQGRSKIKALFR